MLFSATYACPACMLRFSRRTRCPGCGGARVLSLHTAEERADFRRLSERSRSAAGGAALATIADWAPARSWFAVGFGLLLFVPACVLLLRYGASANEPELPAMALAGGLLLSFAFLTRAARSATKSSEKAAEPRKLLVHAGTSKAHETTLRGVVRHASVTLESPIAGTPCVAFGLRGDIDGAQIDDAEGGDFDLELESGERVMVSLEHARIVDAGAVAPSLVIPTPYLEELLGDRGIGVVDGGRSLVRVRVTEVVVREGDVVTIEAEISGGAALSFSERAPSRVRVAAGDESNPLVVRPA